MIKTIIKGNEYDIPTSWQDLTYTKGVEVVELIKLGEQDDVLCHVIGIDKEILHSLSANDVAKLFIVTEFFTDLTLIDSELPQEKYKSIDYGTLPYGDTEAIRIIMSNNSDKNFLQLAPQVIKKITGDDISNEPFSEVIGSVGFFLNQWIAFTSNSMNSTKQKQIKGQNSQELTGSEGSGVLVLG